MATIQLKKTTKAPSASVKSATPIGHGVGRRKSSVARAWMRSNGAGRIIVNGKEYASYFDTEKTRFEASRPLSLLSDVSYDFDINVEGGGKCSQADAIKLAIARAIVGLNEEMRPALRKDGLLTVDSRLKERKKPGQRGARRKFQFVKR